MRDSTMDVMGQKNKKTSYGKIFINIFSAILICLVVVIFTLPVKGGDEKAASKCLGGNKDFSAAAQTKTNDIKDSKTQIENAEKALKNIKTQVDLNKDTIAALRKADDERFKAEADTKKIDDELKRENKTEIKNQLNERLASAKSTSAEKADAYNKLKNDEKNRNAAQIYEVVKKNEDAIAEKKKTIQAALDSIEFKRGQILEKYEKLVSGTRQKGKELEAQPGDPADRFSEPLKIGKIDANSKYEKLLEAKCLADLCTADDYNPPDTKATACQAKIDAAAAEAGNLRKQMLELTHLEQQKNAGMKFNVTDTISLTRGRKTVASVVNQIADWMITLVGSLAVTALIIGGGMMVISGGSETRLETGKTIFTYSLIGLVVTLLAFGIVTFLQSLFYP